MNDTKNGKNNATIFIIEDDQFLLDLLIRKLKNKRFGIITATTGEEGLIKIKEKSPDLILLDLILPGIHGFNVLEQLKNDPELKKIPVIVLSNLGQEEEIQKGLSLGAESFLIKANLAPDEIVEKINEILAK